MTNPSKGNLRVWHIPQIPGKPIRISVRDLAEADLVMGTLAKYDEFQFDNNIKPDYSNAQGLEVFDGSEWTSWYSDDGGEFDKFVRKYRSMELELPRVPDGNTLSLLLQAYGDLVLLEKIDVRTALENQAPGTRPASIAFIAKWVKLVYAGYDESRLDAGEIALP